MRSGPRPAARVPAPVRRVPARPGGAPGGAPSTAPAGTPEVREPAPEPEARAEVEEDVAAATTARAMTARAMTGPDHGRNPPAEASAEHHPIGMIEPRSRRIRRPAVAARRVRARTLIELDAPRRCG